MSNAKALRPIPATLIPGAGIGREITEGVVGILDALGAPLEWDRQLGGMAATKEGSDSLPSSLIDSIRQTKGATRLLAAALRTLQGNVRTRDLGRKASTKDFTSAIAARLGDQGS